MGQSSGWLMSSISSTPVRASRAFAGVHVHHLPFGHVVAHAGASFGAFSTSTRHIRHTPATGSPGW